MDNDLSISELSKETGLSQSLIRVWEQRYDWPRPRRRENGYRCYPRHYIQDLMRMQVLSTQGVALRFLIIDGVPQWPVELVTNPKPILRETIIVPPLNAKDEETLKQTGARVADDNRLRWSQLLMNRDAKWVGMCTSKALLCSSRPTVEPEDVDSRLNPRKATVWVHPATTVSASPPMVLPTQPVPERSGPVSSATVRKYQGRFTKVTETYISAIASHEGITIRRLADLLNRSYNAVAYWIKDRPDLVATTEVAGMRTVHLTDECKVLAIANGISVPGVTSSRGGEHRLCAHCGAQLEQGVA